MPSPSDLLLLVKWQERPCSEATWEEGSTLLRGSEGDRQALTHFLLMSQAAEQGSRLTLETCPPPASAGAVNKEADSATAAAATPAVDAVSSVPEPASNAATGATGSKPAANGTTAVADSGACQVAADGDGGKSAAGAEQGCSKDSEGGGCAPPPAVAHGPLPVFRDGRELRSYQVAGVEWLYRKYSKRTNCMLADEMGLGKTLQVRGCGGLSITGLLR